MEEFKVGDKIYDTWGIWLDVFEVKAAYNNFYLADGNAIIVIHPGDVDDGRWTLAPAFIPTWEVGKKYKWASDTTEGVVYLCVAFDTETWVILAWESPANSWHIVRTPSNRSHYVEVEEV